MFIGRTDAKAETPVLWPPHAELTHWKRLWCWEGLGAGRERDNRGWDGWMASPTRWAWVWVNSGSWWWTGRPGVLQFMGSQSLTWLSDWTDWHRVSSRLHVTIVSLWQFYVFTSDSDSFVSSCLVVITRTFTLNRSSERGHPYLIPEFSGKAFSFSPLGIIPAVSLS